MAGLRSRTRADRKAAGSDRNAERQGSGRPSGTARDRAVGLLAVRWRSEAELRRRLRAAGFADDDIEPALDGLRLAGLVDDGRFAREVVRDQATRRQASARAIRSALREKGVEARLVEEAMADAGDDGERALGLARSRAHRLAGLPPETAFRRLYGLLVRRGYGPDVARQACRAALAGTTEEPELLD